MSARTIVFASILAITAGTTGCGGVQKAVDKEIVSGSMGKSYQKDVVDSSANYGPEKLAVDLADGSKLHIHVNGYESSSSTWLGVWGSSEYSYRVFAFKVDKDRVNDWAYALYEPDEDFTHVFGFTIGYDDGPAVEYIKKHYPELLKTSSDGSVKAWQ